MGATLDEWEKISEKKIEDFQKEDTMSNKKWLIKVTHNNIQ